VPERFTNLWTVAHPPASAAEAESHLEIARALSYVNARQYQALLGDLDAIQRMLRRLMINLP